MGRDSCENLLRMRIQLYIRPILLLFLRLRLHTRARDGMRIKGLVGRVWAGFLDRRVHEGRVERHLAFLLSSVEVCSRLMRSLVKNVKVVHEWQEC